MPGPSVTFWGTWIKRKGKRIFLMDKSFMTRVTVELIGEDSHTVVHRTVAEDFTMDLAEVGVYMATVSKALNEALLVANAQMFKA